LSLKRNCLDLKVYKNPSTKVHKSKGRTPFVVYV
jgi:hypothetical protein